MSVEAIQAPNRVLIFIAALATVFVTAIESTIVATAMPTIVGELGDFALLSWVFTSYLLTQVVTIPIYGRLSDIHGRKPILLIGIVLFLAGSVLCGFASSMTSLILFRVVQGLGAGALMPVGRTLVGDIYHGAERARMQGYVSSVFVGAALLGPLVGSFLATETIWPLVFWVNVPIAVLAGAILIWALHERIEKRLQRIDWGGAALLGLGSGALMFALAEMARLGAVATTVIVVASILILIGFAFYERTVPGPIWPPSLWRDRMASCGNLVSVAIGCAMMGILAYLPVYMQGVAGATATSAGIAVMAISATSPIGAFSAGRIMLRSSYRAAALCGGALFVIGTLMMTMLSPTSTVTWAVVSGILLGLGLGLSNNTYMVAIQSDTGWNQRGVATSAFIFSRILGQSMGTAIFGGIVNAHLAHYLTGNEDPVERILSPALRQTIAPETFTRLVHSLDSALHVVFWVLVGLGVLVLTTSFLLPKGRTLK